VVLRSVPEVTLTVGSAAVERYAAAWRETDAAARRTLLDTCWAEDGVYCDPLNPVEGRDGLSSLIGSFQEENPGARIDVVSGVDEHDGYLRFAWRMLAADGSIAVEGTDFGEVDGEGTLRRIVGFFGPLPGGAGRLSAAWTARPTPAFRSCRSASAGPQRRPSAS